MKLPIASFVCVYSLQVYKFMHSQYAMSFVFILSLLLICVRLHAERTSTHQYSWSSFALTLTLTCALCMHNNDFHYIFYFCKCNHHRLCRVRCSLLAAIYNLTYTFLFVSIPLLIYMNRWPAMEWRSLVVVSFSSRMRNIYELWIAMKIIKEKKKKKNARRRDIEKLSHFSHSVVTINGTRIFSAAVDLRARAIFFFLCYTNRLWRIRIISCFNSNCTLNLCDVMSWVCVGVCVCVCVEESILCNLFSTFSAWPSI